MWDQHALNIARQRFPGEIRPDSKAFRSLQKATPDELNLVEQALDERLAERAAPRVDVPPAAMPEVAPTAPDPRKPWETPSIRIERARRGTRLPVPGQPSTRVPFGKEPSAPAVAPSPAAAPSVTPPTGKRVAPTDIRNRVLGFLSDGKQHEFGELYRLLGYDRPGYMDDVTKHPVNAELIKMRDEGLITSEKPGGWGESLIALNKTPAPAPTAPTVTRQLTGPTGNTVTAYGTDPNRV